MVAKESGVSEHTKYVVAKESGVSEHTEYEVTKESGVSEHTEYGSQTRVILNIQTARTTCDRIQP